MKARISISGTAGSERFALERASLFDESASCIHAAAGTDVAIEAKTDTELTVYRCRNDKPFPARIFTPDQVPNEHRGKGQVAGRCLRFVRTIFDVKTSPPDAELVLGEVERFELPNLGALNFLLHNALDGGGTMSLMTDAQGKTFSTAMLRMEVDLPDDLAALVEDR